MAVDLIPAIRGHGSLIAGIPITALTALTAPRRLSIVGPSSTGILALALLNRPATRILFALLGGLTVFQVNSGTTAQTLAYLGGLVLCAVTAAMRSGQLFADEPYTSVFRPIVRTQALFIGYLHTGLLLSYSPLTCTRTSDGSGTGA